jgi:hypothetical protein
MEILTFVVIPMSILMALGFVLYQTNIGKYKLKFNGKNNNEEENFNNFHKDFPDKDMQSLKIEIEKISDMLLDNQESNRYTYKIQEKAKNDYKLDEFRNEIPDSVDILNYKDGKLKAQVNYLTDGKECTLIMYMNIVKKGRIFLNNYKTMKRVVN